MIYDIDEPGLCCGRHWSGFGYSQLDHDGGTTVGNVFLAALHQS